MNHTKGQFYAIWVIFGFAVYYALVHLAGFFNEVIINLGILFDINPIILKYSGIGFYGIIWIAIIISSILIVRRTVTKTSHKDYKIPKGGFLILVILGLLSQIATAFTYDFRTDNFEKYLVRHEINYMDLYPEYPYGYLFPHIAIFITLIVLFYILTRNRKEKTNASMTSDEK